MSIIKIPTPFNIDVEFELSEFYRRLLALVIDWVIQVLYAYLLVKVLTPLYFSMDPDAYRAVVLAAILPLGLYHLIFEALRNGQSPGKSIMSIRVVHESGGRPSFSQFFIRWVLRLSDFMALIVFANFFEATQKNDVEEIILYGLGFGFIILDLVLVAGSKKAQRIGDLLAGTILIRTNARMNLDETVFQEVADTYTPKFPQIMQLSDRDINAIKGILDTARRKNDYMIATGAANRIKNYLKVETDMDDFQFLDVLLKDYNYLSVK